MFGRNRDKDVIDAGAELDRADAERIEGEHGPSELGAQRRPSPPGAKAFLLVVLVCVVALGATFTWKAMQVKGASEDEVEQDTTNVRQVIPSYTPRPVRPEPEPEPEQREMPQVRTEQQQPQVVYRQPEQTGPTEAELVRQRMLNSPLSGQGMGAGMGDATGQQVAVGGQVPPPGSGSLLGNGSGGELAERLQPMRLSGSGAGILPNRDLLITQGAMLDCVLETRVITTQPGMTSCHLTRDVYSANGRVVLLDRGSKVTGFYQGGITQGQARIFVQWSRVETPEGVVINLDSPGTGPLGEAGIGGYVDRHFWERFGGAILISMIGDLGDWASNQNRNQGDNSIQFTNTSDGIQEAATEALRNSINIPPTLYKNQGERVSIFVARDLDFSDVYSLTAN
ncbi:type IV secretion system protein VirB10 [Pokkaliibacter sp. MBI-7]|uniref:type IV secretion system protein VirB10 n=1 Tax=Pokkaliibacter sp. MBI-7 TaxID=3040600 RepID=UPI002449845C|nr:type IV secretion system protein VirB10 [Pokkaliibacter sp. MBI-7]MDH2436872.1 type IV secretion system protein VirB10 [Pokkaliibacter sp. MBI-7]